MNNPGSPPIPAPPGPSSDGTRRVLDHWFRHEYGRLVAILTRQLGAARLGLAEDVVQDALLRASQVWPYRGVPPNPTAWLLVTARNRARDICRRDSRWSAAVDQITHTIESTATQACEQEAATFAHEIRDAELRMMMVCCHPRLSTDGQLALILKTLAGFGEQEIAAAFLVKRETVAKRLVRARRTLRDERIETDLPPDAELPGRVKTILHALYLLFNEGYKASTGEVIIRAELCREADRLLAQLQAWPPADLPETQAMAALFAFHQARFPARLDEAGQPILLAEQNRSRWDRTLLRRGMACLARSAAGDQVSRYHLEAGIAACHSLAPSYEKTDWNRIIDLYARLEKLAPSPAVSINRALALAEATNDRAGLEHLTTAVDERQVADYHLYFSAKAKLLHGIGSPEALPTLEHAIALAPLSVEKEQLQGLRERWEQT